MKIAVYIAEIWFYLASACLLCLWATGTYYLVQIRSQLTFKPKVSDTPKRIFKYSGISFLVLGLIGFIWALVGTIFEPQIRSFLNEKSNQPVQPTSLRSAADR